MKLIKFDRRTIIIIVCVFILSLATGAIRFGYAKRSLAHQVNLKLQQILQQQQWLLERLGKRIVTAWQQYDQYAVILHLRAYEDLAYSLAKQNLSLPLNINFVSLSNPTLVLGGEGRLDATALATDESYYLRSTEDPHHLQVSKPYLTNAMPGHLFCNLGMGVFDQNDAYIGQLDIKIALDSLQKHLLTSLPSYKSWFHISLSEQSISNIAITLNHRTFWPAFVEFTLNCFAGLLVIVFGCAGLYTSYRRKQKLYQELQYVTRRFEQANAENLAKKIAERVQNKYSVIAAGANDAPERVVDLAQLINDVRDINADIALQRQVVLDFPAQQLHTLCFYGHELRLMQILSGIVHETLQQLTAKSKLSMQVLINNQAANMHQIIFKFDDNGFYATLQDNQSSGVYSDVRAKGWGNIRKLVAMENGVLEHTHVAYKGNVICFYVTVRAVSKVVKLEAYKI